MVVQGDTSIVRDLETVLQSGATEEGVFCLEEVVSHGRVLGQGMLWPAMGCRAMGSLVFCLPVLPRSDER